MDVSIVTPEPMPELGSAIPSFLITMAIALVATAVITFGIAKIGRCKTSTALDAAILVSLLAALVAAGGHIAWRHHTVTNLTNARTEINNRNERISEEQLATIENAYELDNLTVNYHGDSNWPVCQPETTMHTSYIIWSDGDATMFVSPQENGQCHIEIFDTTSGTQLKPKN